MPQQEVFMDERIGDRRVQILKTYDAAYARAVFDAMDGEALKFLELQARRRGSAGTGRSDFADTIWQEVEDVAREDWNKFSYFVVTECAGNGTNPPFVSADWPTLEAFEKTLI